MEFDGSIGIYITNQNAMTYLLVFSYNNYLRMLKRNN